MTTRIWFENDAIQVDGLEAQPARSLVTALDGDRVHVLTLSGVRLAQLVYGQYARKDGSGFSSAATAKAYLDGEFAKAPVPTWDAVTGKPAVYPPAVHTHAFADLTSIPAAFPPSAHTHPWGDITGKPTSYPPSAHTHAIADVTGLQAALDAKLGSTIAPSGLARAIGSAFQPSATKPVLASYSVKTSVTNPLLVGASAATVTLLSDANNPPTTERARVSAESSVGVAVAVAITTANTAPLTYLVPPAHYVRLVSTVTGTGTTAIVSQTETTLG